MKSFEFHETVAAVEERFRPTYDVEKMGQATMPTQVETTMVSTGWWVVLARFGVAIRFGSTRPTLQGKPIEPGDTLVLVPRLIKRKPGATAPAKPDAPKPIGTPQLEVVDGRTS